MYPVGFGAVAFLESKDVKSMRRFAGSLVANWFETDSKRSFVLSILANWEMSNSGALAGMTYEGSSNSPFLSRMSF